MANKKRGAAAKKSDVLLPHVADEPQRDASEPLTGGALRAQRTVDGLIRDLFGKDGGVGLATREEEPIDSVEAIDFEPFAEEVQEQAEQPPLTDTVEQPGAYPAFAQDDLKDDAEQAQSEALAQPLSFKEQIEASNEEFRLLLDMEYEQELGEAIGFEKIRAYHENAINGRRSARKQRAERNTEFEVQEQETDIRRRYGRAKRNGILRLGATVVFLALLLIYENASLMQDLFGDFFDVERYPAPYILIGLQLLLLDAVLCYRPLREGFSHLLHFSPIDHSPYALVLGMTFVYHALLILLPAERTPAVFFAPAALTLVLLAVSELLNLYRQTHAFDVVAAHRQKYAVMPRISVGGTQSSARERLAQSSCKGNKRYLHPVGFVRNYVANTAKHEGKHRNLGAHFLLVAGLGAALSLFVLAGEGTSAKVLTTFFVTMLICAPAISSLLTSAPLFFAGCFALRGKGAIIGEMPLAECGKNDEIVLPDHEIFVEMEHRQFRLIGLCDAHRVSVLARALLEKVQSPLAGSISVDGDSRISASELSFLHIGKDGVGAKVTQTGDIIFIGTAAYLASKDIQLPASCAEEQYHGGYAPLYIAMDGAACAMLGVRYVLAADAEHLLYRLHRAGFSLLVRSKDPCVRDEVLDDLFPDFEVRVEKPTADEVEVRTDRVDSNVVALGSCKELARTLLCCRRVQRVGFFGRLLQLASVVVGGALIAVCTVLNASLSSTVITLWMLWWCAIYALISYFSLRRTTDDI